MSTTPCRSSGIQISALPDAWMVPPLWPKRIVRDIPEKLDALIAALMSVDPARRPRSANEVIERLTAIAELEPDDSPTVARSFLVGSQLIDPAARSGARYQLGPARRASASWSVSPHSARPCHRPTTSSKRKAA